MGSKIRNINNSVQINRLKDKESINLKYNLDLNNESDKDIMCNNEENVSVCESRDIFVKFKLDLNMLNSADKSDEVQSYQKFKIKINEYEDSNCNSR